jgi:hypothetical protein
MKALRFPYHSDHLIQAIPHCSFPDTKMRLRTGSILNAPLIPLHSLLFSMSYVPLGFGKKSAN